MPRKTIQCTAASLDGFIATEGPSLDRPFPLGDPQESHAMRPAASMLRR